MSALITNDPKFCVECKCLLDKSREDFGICVSCLTDQQIDELEEETHMDDDFDDGYTP